MKIKKMMDTIIDKGNKYDMDLLDALFVDMVYYIKEKDTMRYKEFYYKLHTTACGSHMTEDEALDWVANMQNKDGTTGEHWSYEQTESVKKQYNIEANCWDWYIVLNMVYSDYYSTKFDTATYIELAKDWLDDEDIGKDKLLKYYIFVVK